MRSIAPFSKKSSPGPTVGGGGQRKGFMDHVKSTKAPAGKAVPHMAATYPTKSTLDRTSGKSAHYPPFKSGGGKPKSAPAFSKKHVGGGPSKPGTPA